MATGDTSRRTMVIVAGVVTALVLVGALLSHIGRPPPGGERPTGDSVPPRPTAPTDAAGPVGEQAGMAVGFNSDEDGAVAAAVTYATASQRWLYFTDDEIHDAVAHIATPAATERLAREVVADVSTAREQLGASSGRVWWLVRPLAYTVEAHSEERGEARVSVWVVTVLSAVEVAAPQSEWMTVTVDLAWVDGDWRVDAVRDVAGPTPMTGPKDRPWVAEPFDDTLAEFTRLDGEPLG